MTPSKWTESQKRYALSPKGLIARKKYQSSEKAKECRRRYQLKRKARLAEAKQIVEAPQVQVTQEVDKIEKESAPKTKQ